jgi:hypothetical protein
VSSILHFLAVDAGRGTCIVDSGAHFVAALHVDVFDVEGVDVAGEKTEERKEQVDEEVGAAACYEEDA